MTATAGTDSQGYDYPHAPAGAPQEAPRSGRSGLSCFLTGCLVLALVVVGGCAALLVFGWKPFVRYSIATDLTEYHRMVSGSDLAEEPKARVLAQIEALREKARHEGMGFMPWTDYDESIRGLIEDKQIPPDELALLERELERLEKEFNGGGATPEAEPAPASEPPPATKAPPGE
jgi:hypothetical protein